MQCPDCKGNGVLENMRINMGDKPNILSDVKCQLCDGEVRISNEMANLIKECQDLRNKEAGWR